MRGMATAPPLVSGHGLADPNPAGAVAAGVPDPVPVEPDLDPAIFVGVDLLALGPHHDGRLDPVHHRARRDPGRPEGHLVGDAHELVDIFRRLRRRLPIDPREESRLVQVVDDLGEDIGLVVEVFPIVVLQREAESAGKGAAGARSPEGGDAALLGLHPDRREPVSRVSPGVGPGVVIELPVPGTQPLHSIHRYREIGFGGLEVEIAEGALPGPDLLEDAEVRKNVRRQLAAAGPLIHRLFLAGAGIVLPWGVRQHQGVLFLLVFEKVKNPLFLEEPGDEIEIGFPVLDRIFPGLVRSAEAKTHIVQGMLAEKGLDDLRHSLVLEDPAVGGLGQQPEPGNQGGGIECIPHFDGLVPSAASLAEAGNHAVEAALPAVGQFDGDRDVLADDLIEGDGVVLRDQPKFKAEKAGDALGSAKACKEQYISPQGRVDGKWPVFLGGAHETPFGWRFGQIGIGVVFLSRIDFYILT